MIFLAKELILEPLNTHIESILYKNVWLIIVTGISTRLYILNLPKFDANELDPEYGLLCVPTYYVQHSIIINIVLK